MKQLLMLFFLTLIYAQSVYAHGLHLFATATSTKITGRVYVSGGNGIEGATVKLFVEGKFIAETLSDNAGAWSINSKKYDTASLYATTIDGHKATFVLHSHTKNEQLTCTESETETSLNDAITRAIYPLHEKIDSLEHTLRFRDILGGVGIIMGIVGVVCYMASRKKE